MLLTNSTKNSPTVLAIALILVFQAYGFAHADETGRTIISEWADWIEACPQSFPSAKIVEKEDGQEHSMEYVLTPVSSKRFYWSHRYFHGHRGWTTNVVAGNKDYVFTLKEIDGEPKLAALNTRDESDFVRLCDSLYLENQYTRLLLAGAGDSILSLCKTGNVQSTIFPDPNTAEIKVAVSVASDSYDIKSVNLSFQRSTGWLPKQVSWSVVSIPSGAETLTTYRYIDWINLNNQRLPARVDTVVENGGTKSTRTNEIVYALPKAEEADATRFFLKDFGLPEPAISSSIPNWIWLSLGGVLCLLIAGCLKWRDFRSRQLKNVL